MSNEPENQPTIFLIEPDDETRPVLRSNLQRYGYRVVIALDEEDAMERADGVGIQADLILVDVVRIPLEDALGVGRRICDYAKRDGGTPLVVMAEQYGVDLQGTDVNVGGNDWITYIEHSGQLKNLLARLVPQPAT